VSTREGDPPSLRFIDVSNAKFERYNPLRRLESEVRYGRRLARLVTKFRPDVVVSNAPLVVQALLWRSARRTGTRRVYWLQDFLGRGTRTVLSARSALLGASFGRAFEALETRLLHQADALIVIADDFLDELKRRGVNTPTEVIENWAPVDELPTRDRYNAWSSRHALDDCVVALYSGTLGLKHDPEHLVRAAEALGTGQVLVVITEGTGREALERARAQRDLKNLVLLDYVPYDVLPDVLGAAEVCLVLLEPEAGTFSVPSKTLSYFAAGRAVVGAVPAENLAAKTVLRAGAGIIVEPGDYEGFASAVCNLLSDSQRTASMGAAGRAYAEDRFDIAEIGDRFVDVIHAQAV